MRLEFNKLVASDISRIMDYYEDVAGPQLADDFYINRPLLGRGHLIYRVCGAH
jgi:hypothetical protein